MSSSHRQEKFEALWPSGALGVPVAPAATRHDTLAGKKIAFVWDYVFRGEEMFPVIEQSLKQQYDDLSFVSHAFFGSIFGGDEESVLEELPGKLRELDVHGVICGVGC